MLPEQKGVNLCQDTLLKELFLGPGLRQKVYKKHIPPNFHSGDKISLSPSVPFHFKETVITKA